MENHLLRILRKSFFYLVLVPCVLVVLLFAVNNHAKVTVSLFPLPFEAEMPLFLLAILFFCFGLLAGGLSLSLQRYRMSKLIRSLRRKEDALEAELALLKQEPHETTPALPAAGTV